MQQETVDEAVAVFYDKLFAILTEIVPQKRLRTASVYRQPWWTSELRHLRNGLRKARKRFFLTKSEDDRNSLRVLEMGYKVRLWSAYDDYLKRIQSDVKQNPSSFWNFVKNQKTATRIPSTVKYEESIASTNSEAANLFAKFFESVFNKSSPVPRRNCFDHLVPTDINLPVIQFSIDEVLDAMNNTDVDKGPGTDGIPPLLLKNCSTALASPVTLLFNRSLLDMVFPMAWKSACVIPVYKSGNCNRVTNYRGISILCSLSKIFEKMVHHAVYNAASSLLSTNQHGFMKHRSTTTNLMCFVNFLSREMEQRRQVDTVYVDFAKAFDTVPHILVIDKMNRLGFPEWFTQWLLSQLTKSSPFS